MNDLFIFNTSFQDSFEINTNFFDTNLINLSIVLAIVIRFLGEALVNILEERKQVITKNLQDSNKKILVVKTRLSDVESKLKQAQLETTKLYDSRFSVFSRKKEELLNQVDSYLTQLQSLENEVVNSQTKKVLSDIYDKTVAATFNTLCISLAKSFKQSGKFSNKRKTTTYNYLKKLTSFN